MTHPQSVAYVIGDLILARSEELAERVTTMQYDRQPELHQRFGPRGRVKTLQDTVYNLRYLAQSAQIASPLLFANYVAWLRILLAGYKITADDLRVNLECISEALKQELSQEQHELLEVYLQQSLQLLQAPLEVPPSFLETSLLREDAEHYVALLLQGKRAEAGQLIMGLVEQGVPIEEIYLHIFQQAQYEIGRLWQTNTITVAQEHYFTAATQSIMSQLYPYIFSTSRRGYKLVAACVGEELHEIGLRMLSDMFELNGWDTYYVGANVPTNAIVRTLQEQQADVLAISVTMTYHVSLVRNLIEQLRQHEAGRKVKVMVGGLPFNIDQELWRQVGADGYAPDASEAIRVAYTLLGNRAAGQ